MSSYGVGAATYHAAGGIAGIRRLVDDFYDIMDEDPNAEIIRKTHPDNLEVARDKLACFLSGWMGGEALYAEKYGSINIPQAHAFIKIGEEERDSWLDCMEGALAKQNYSEDFQRYLMKQFAVPAERIRLASEAYHNP